MGIMTSMLGSLVSINEYILAAIEMVSVCARHLTTTRHSFILTLSVNFTVPLIQTGHQLAFSVDHVISVRIHVSITAPVHKATVDHI